MSSPRRKDPKNAIRSIAVRCSRIALGRKICTEYFNQCAASEDKATNPSPTNLVLYDFLMTERDDYQVELELKQATDELRQISGGISGNYANATLTAMKLLHSSSMELRERDGCTEEDKANKKTKSAAATAAIYHFLNQKEMEERAGLNPDTLKRNSTYLPNAEQGFMISRKIYGTDPRYHRAAGILLMVFGAAVIAASGLALAVTCGVSELAFLSSLYLATMIAGGVAGLAVGARAIRNRNKYAEVSSLPECERTTTRVLAAIGVTSSLVSASPFVASSLGPAIGMTDSGIYSFLTHSFVGSAAGSSSAALSFGAFVGTILGIGGGFASGIGLMVKGYQLIRGSYSAEAKASQSAAALFKPALEKRRDDGQSSAQTKITSSRLGRGCCVVS